MLTAAMTASDRALLSLLAVEEGAAMPLQTAAVANNPFPQLLAEKMVAAGPGGRFVLTAAGRQRATEARTRARAGSIGASPLRAVR